MNNIKTAVLLAAMSGLLIAIGGSLGGSSGALMALVFAGVMNFGSYWFSADIVLKTAGAHEIKREQDPALFGLIEGVAQDAGMPMPRVYVMDEMQPNAFATGRNPQHAAVAVTTGIRQLLTERELRGVLGHELAHVKNRDILISTISATLAGAVSSLAQFGALFGGRGEVGRPANPVVAVFAMLLAPFAALLVQMAISRAREFEADRGAAEIGGDPQALAAALEKIHRQGQGVPLEAAESHPATAQMMIMNPLSGGALSGLFSTHPDTGERIERLLAMARSGVRP